MDLSLFLSIVGTLGTIVFGLMSLSLFKKIRNPGEITCVEDIKLNVINSIVKSYKRFTVYYDDEIVNKNVIYYKGNLLNTGSIDITESKVEKTLILEVPEKFKIIDAKITDATFEENKGILIQNENKLRFDLGLFKVGEFIQFEMFIESKDKVDELLMLNNDEIKIYHRIAEIRPLVKREKYPEKDKIVNKFFTALIFAFIAIAFGSTLITYKVYYYPKIEKYISSIEEKEIKFIVLTNDNIAPFSIPMIGLDSNVFYINNDSLDIDTIPLKDLKMSEKFTYDEETYSTSILIREIQNLLKLTDKEIIRFFWVMIILTLTIAVWILLSMRKSLRIINILGNSS